jgi:hypothetical protein
MPPILPQNVQIAMSLRDTTTDEMANFRESQAQGPVRSAIASSLNHFQQ